MNKEEKLMLRELYSSVNANQKLLLEKLFPTLKESEDEGIRKGIFKALSKKDARDVLIAQGIEVSDALAWLEKQSKKEYALKSCEHEDVRKFMQFFEKRAKAYEIELPNRSYDIYALAKDILAWLEKQGEQKDIINNQLDFVDLGLPSGTLWAKCNLGAEKETDFGLYYQWGDTQGYEGVDKHQFNWDDYKYGSSDKLSKYNENDDKLILDNEDDPVFVATNGMFKMPTQEQLQELIDHTNHEWIENFKASGVNGMKFTNKKDTTKYIFIPAAGSCYYGNHNGVGSWGYVWSTSRGEADVNYAWRLYFDSGEYSMYNTYRCLGYSVRGVK